MCLILMALDCHAEYRLVIAANRDEDYARPTEGADFWPDYPDILAGRDLLQLGTWLGITRAGRFAALTNYRDPLNFRQGARSRGELVGNYLQANERPEEYLKKVQATAINYNGFNVLLGDIHSIYYYGNTEKRITKLEPGYYGLSNHLLDTPWTKVAVGKKALQDALSDNKKVHIPEIFKLLSDRRKAEDRELPNTGVGLLKERLLSSIFIDSEDYGTRSSTVVTVNRDNHVVFTERKYFENDHAKWEERQFEFDITM
ncbi:MAG: hypothetical protein CVU87_00695 [Firmicutes bacterium HGW-Firmicutes-12]|nr:MAG: hypothetical protein CVU87_00695 [Firmicutes bacterium HGW-Firmicutes-12]